MRLLCKRLQNIIYALHISNTVLLTYVYHDLLTHIICLATATLSTVSQVKFLEGNLEQAKHVESGRNALVKQITKLEEEVKHAHHRLEIHRAEALVRKSVTSH